MTQGRGDREARDDATVVTARPDLGGGAATPSVRLPPDADPGMPGTPRALRLRGSELRWGTRTYVMGIVNVTPDSFSGDGLLDDGGDPVAAAVEQGRAMVAEGADLLDVGGESTRPGHAEVSVDEELRRVVPVISALRSQLPDTPISVDTTKALVAEAGLGAGADLAHPACG